MTDTLVPPRHDHDELPTRRRSSSRRRHARLPRLRVALPRALSWRSEAGIVTVVLVAYASYLAATIHRATRVYLPPDGAHYLGEADTILGRGVLHFIHPPAFATFVALCRAVSGSELTGLLVAVVTALTLTYLALYLLLRQWVPVLPALVGASVAMVMPTIGELIGWAAGATILGLAFGLLALAAFEHWIRTRTKTGVLVGLALALTVLAHPFTLLVTGVCLAVRWSIELAHAHGRITRDWSPVGWVGLASVAAPVLLAGVVTVSYYGHVDAPTALSLGSPAPGTLNQLLHWATPGNGLLYALAIVALGSACIATTRGATEIAGTLAALVVAVPTLVRADSSYQSRVMYYLPVLVAVTVAFTWTRLAPHIHTALGHPRSIAVAAFAAVALPAFTTAVGLQPHTATAINYYGRLHPDDIRLVQQLRHGTGTVATSWSQNDYASGDSSSWYVSGLAKRPALGPAAPWLVTRAAERRTGQDLQRFFAGTLGTDNNQLQLASDPINTAGQVAINATVAGIQHGYFFPYLALNPGGLRYPAELPGAEHFPIAVGAPTFRATAQGLTATYPDARGEPAVRGTLALHGSDLDITYRSLQPVAGAWRLTLRPASGAPWTEQHATTDTIALSEPVAGHTITSTIHTTTPDAAIGLVTLDPTTNTTELAISTGDTTSVSFTIHVDGTDSAAPARTFSASAIAAQHDITSVVVFKSAGIAARFANDPCLHQTDESSSLLVFTGEDDCAAAGI